MLCLGMLVISYLVSNDNMITKLFMMVQKHLHFLKDKKIILVLSKQELELNPDEGSQLIFSPWPNL